MTRCRAHECQANTTHGAALIIFVLTTALAWGQQDSDARDAANKRLRELDNQIGELHADGRDAEAVPFAREALALSEKTYGPENSETSASLNNLAVLLKYIGALDEARGLYERALTIDEKADPRGLDAASSHNNLGAVLQALSDLSASKEHYELAMQIWEERLGPSDPATALALNNLAGVEQAMGDLAAARIHFERGLAIREKVPGPDDPLTASSLNNLALLLQEMGQLQAALPLFQRSLAIRIKRQRAGHPDIARGLNNLASVLQDLGRRDEALELYQRALDIRLKAFGEKSTEVAWNLNDLATLLQQAGRFDEARVDYEKSLEIRRSQLGPDHPLTAQSIGNLAALCLATGDLSKAQSLLAQALSIRETRLGAHHPQTTEARDLLGLVEESLGHAERARDLFGPAWKDTEQVVHALLPTLSTEERLLLLRQRSFYLRDYLRAMSASPALTYDAALGWKGSTLRASAAAQRLPEDASEEAKEAARELAGARRELARLVNSPPPPTPGQPTVAEQYEKCSGDVGRLERKLSDLLPEFARRAFLDVTVPDVLAALPPGAVLVDLLENRGTLHAWVLAKDGDVRYFNLGAAADFDPLARRFREAVEGNDRKGWEEAGRALRGRLEKPLAAALANAKRLYISPDGVLATIPWGLLPDGEKGSGKMLLERLPILYTLGGAGMVMASHPNGGAPGKGLLAIGGVDYEKAEGAPGRVQRSSTIAPELKESETEAARIATRFESRFPGAPVQVRTGKEATESAFKRAAHAAKYIHVATHGYFDLEHLRAAHQGDRALTAEMGSAQVLEMSNARTSAISGWNPLLLSGLVLAGANNSDGGDGEDGWLTSEELQGLDLRGVELVVLSACDTGRGELAAGEGVLGLSRALAVAGARGFLLSLWKVPDKATPEFMDAFYEGLWAKEPLSAEEALRATQLAMLAQDRAANDSFGPRNWGAWVLIR